MQLTTPDHFERVNPEADMLLLIHAALAARPEAVCPGLNVVFNDPVRMRGTLTRGDQTVQIDRTLYQSRCGISIWTEPNGAGIRVVVGTEEAHASIECDGVPTRGVWRPTIFPDATSRFVCYNRGKAQVVRRDASEWDFGPLFDEIGPDALRIGERDAYVARRGLRWLAVWGKETSESHGAVEIGSDCQSPVYLAADEDGYRVYPWGKAPTPATSAKPELPSCPAR